MVYYHNDDLYAENIVHKCLHKNPRALSIPCTTADGLPKADGNTFRSEISGEELMTLYALPWQRIETPPTSKLQTEN